MEHTIFDLNNPVEVKAAQDAVIIATQNDQFRKTWGADFTIGGQIVMTRSVADMPPSTQVQIMQGVQKFETFDADNDPYGDHSFGSIKVMNEGVETSLFWKFDYYDLDLKGGSENPSDLAATRRVLTIMQPHEY